MAEQTEDVQLPEVPEVEVKFKLISDRSVYKITNEELDVPLVEISGYDLQINFNMQYLKSVEEIEAAKNGLAQLFGELIMEKLLEYKNQQ